jgi:transcriptional regulator with XRE-family HTH domain
MPPKKSATFDYRLEVGKRVKELRDKLGLTQEALANAIGSKDRQTFYKVEAGLRELSYDELPKAAEVLQTTVEYIVKGQSPAGTTPLYGLAESGTGIAQPDLIPLVTYDDAGRHVEGYAERPPCLRGVRNAYAIYVWDECMEPCYSPGELLYVNPAKPARSGRDVVILRRSGPPALRRLERHDGKHVFVKAMTETGATRIPIEEVSGLHLVVGTAEDK